VTWCPVFFHFSLRQTASSPHFGDPYSSGIATSDFYQMKDYHFKDKAQTEEGAYCPGAGRCVQYQGQEYTCKYCKENHEL
jgi:hypothetical protein